MKKLIYFLMAALMVLAAVSCKKDNKPGNDEPEMPVLEEAVDLGMVLSREDGTTYRLYWAKSNLCETGLCANPEDYGDYYAWGEMEPYYTEGHSQDNPCSSWRTREDNPITGYNWESYKFWTSGDSWDNIKLSKYNTMDSHGPVDNITELQRGEEEGETKDDVARAKLGGKWRMPTIAEWTALCTRCTWAWTRRNGIDGQLFTASNGKSIFLPAAGSRTRTSLYNKGSYGYYWSSSLRTDDPNAAYEMNFGSNNVYRGSGGRYLGYSVRPVREE